MIKTKEDLKYYLQEDKKRYGEGIDSLYKRFGHSEQWYLWRFVKKLRYLEYYKNTQSNVFRKLLYQNKNIKMHKLMYEMKIYIHPNTIGPGLYIPHVGKIHVSGYATIGSNFTIRPGAMIASSLNAHGDRKIYVTIGNNVELSEGVKILCKKIGDNVTIAPNTVVTKSVPDNSIAFGNPFEIIPKDI